MAPFWLALILNHLAAFTAAGAAPAANPVDPEHLKTRLGTLGLRLEHKTCQAQTLNEGRGGQLSFTEISFDCGDYSVQLEATHPVQSAVVKGQVDSEVARIQEVYGASKNPYAGYVSQTAQCPEKENLWREKNGAQPLLIGRVTERGAWGACGKSSQDHWAALTFVESGRALAKIRIQSRKPLERARFQAEAKEFLRALKADR